MLNKENKANVHIVMQHYDVITDSVHVRQNQMSIYDMYMFGKRRQVFKF